MNILKFVNVSDNSSESYSAISSALYLKKRGHNVYLMGEKNSYASVFSSKNKLEFIECGIYSKLGFIKIPDCDIVEIYGYSKWNSLVLNKIMSLKSPKILRLTSFPDADFAEFIKKNINSFSLITVVSQSIKDELVFAQIKADKD